MFLSFLVPGAIVPLFSKHLDALGFSPVVIAVCCATQAFGVVFGAPLISQIADRWYPANRCLVVCSFLGSVCLWGLSVARDPLLVFALAALFWLLCSPAMLMVNTICFTHLTAAGKPFGGVRMWGTLGWMAAGWAVGLWLAYDRTPADNFVLGAVFALALALYGLTIPHTPPQPARDTCLAPLAAYRLLRGRSFFVYCVCILGVCITLPFTFQATPFLLRDLGTSDTMLPAILTVAQSTEVLTLPFLTLILGRFGFRGSMLFGLSAWALAMVFLAIGGPWELVVGSQVLNGLCLTCFVIAGQVYVNQLARPDLRASVQGLLNSVNGVGQILGHLCVGLLRWLHDGNTGLTFLVAAILTACLLPIFYLGFREPVGTPTPVETHREPRSMRLQESPSPHESSSEPSIIRA
jgi:MFS family permease